MPDDDDHHHREIDFRAPIKKQQKRGCAKNDLIIIHFVALLLLAPRSLIAIHLELSRNHSIPLGALLSKQCDVV